MTLADDIRKDRDAGTPGGGWRVLDGKHSLQIHSEKHWIANIKCESCPAHEDANARRIARVPALEEAYLAALDALEKAEKLISGDLTGAEWKRACNDFLRTAREKLK